MKLSPAKRILDLAMDGAQHCEDALYAPCIVPGKAIYAMGGHINNGVDQAWGSQKRFADRIWRASIAAQDDKPIEIMNKTLFPWMNNPAEWLWAHPESFIGSVGSPSIVELPGRSVMAFVATVNDQNVCTGEHRGQTPYGPCDAPWSFFAIFFASSDDSGLTWRLERQPDRIPFDGADPSRWMALDHAALFLFPTLDNMRADNAGEFKGLSSVSMLSADDGYFYLLCGIWPSTDGPKNLMFRVPIDLTQHVGHGWGFEIWDVFYGAWRKVRDGRVPRWVNDESNRGWIFGATPNQITRTAQFGDAKYLATLQTPGLAVSTSKDMRTWGASIPIDGLPAGALNPILFEDAAGLHACWAQADPPCAGGEYYGLALYQADVV